MVQQYLIAAGKSEVSTGHTLWCAHTVFPMFVQVYRPEQLIQVYL
jgi:hypothetical protein